MKTSVLGCGAALVLGLAACRSSVLTGPPETRLGKDPCAECDMIISDDRFCCGAVVEVDGIREHQSYDDIGCLLDHMRLHPELRFDELYVRDVDTRLWLEVREGRYVVCGSVRTPMGSGIQAFAKQESAARFASENGVKAIGWEELIANRKAEMESRYGPVKTSGDGR